jgi:hypothetical protein
VSTSFSLYYFLVIMRHVGMNRLLCVRVRVLYRRASFLVFVLFDISMQNGKNYRVVLFVRLPGMLMIFFCSYCNRFVSAMD